MEDEPEERDRSVNWRVWAAEKIGALREMTRTNRERIITLEDEVGVDPPNEDSTRVMKRLAELEEMIEEETPDPGFWGTLNYTISNTQQAALLILIIVAVVVSMLVLTSNGINIMDFIPG